MSLEEHDWQGNEGIKAQGAAWCLPKASGSFQLLGGQSGSGELLRWGRSRPRGAGVGHPIEELGLGRTAVGRAVRGSDWQGAWSGVGLGGHLGPAAAGAQGRAGVEVVRVGWS